MVVQQTLAAVVFSKEFSIASGLKQGSHCLQKFRKVQKWGVGLNQEKISLLGNAEHCRRKDKQNIVTSANMLNTASQQVGLSANDEKTVYGGGKYGSLREWT